MTARVKTYAFHVLWLLLLTMLALTLAACSVGTRPTPTPTTPTPEPTRAARKRPPTRVPTPTPTTTARPAPTNTPTPIASPSPTPLPTVRLVADEPSITPTLAAIPTPTPKNGASGPDENPPPHAPGAFTQLRGAYHQPGPSMRPVLAWRFGAPGGVSSAPAVKDGVVYFGTTQGRFYALDAATGIERWMFQTGGWIRSAPDIAGDLIYFGSDDNNVYALERQTGRLIWRTQLDSPVRAPVTATLDTVYAGTQEGEVYALDALTPREKWRFSAGDPITGRPVLLGDRVIFGTYDGDLIALDVRRGGRLWTAPDVASSTVASPSAWTDTVYGASAYGYVAAVDARTGRVRWRERLGGSAVTTPTVTGDGKRVLAAVTDGSRGWLASLDTRNGRIAWIEPLPAATDSSPALVGDVVYLGTKDDSLYTFNARNGKRGWRFRTRGDVDSSPVVTGGRVYFGSFDGNFYAVGGRRVPAIRLWSVEQRLLRGDRRGDTVNRRLRFADITAAGAQFTRFHRLPGVLFEMQLAQPPPLRGKDQVAYVWAIDTTLDAETDYYLFVDIPPQGRRFRATLERSTPQGLVTVHDRLLFVVRSTSIRVFVPLSPHLESRPDEEQPTLEWYAYSYVGRLPQQDEVSDRGREFVLAPEE
ncbi:MAG: PQQ-binding-like beta-propeller repeat protein [Chloroflexota bacterium]|nr:PQQ-binding-like beta-propeller repeat protein [Chloroflexota bacterium]